MKVKIEKLSKENIELIDRALLSYSLEHADVRQTIYNLASRIRTGELILWNKTTTKKNEE